jgi:hypothetical protein
MILPDNGSFLPQLVATANSKYYVLIVWDTNMW